MTTNGMKTITCVVLLAMNAFADAGPGYTIYPNQPKQTIRGLGFEIQCDSIGSGNNGLPEAPIAVPHDLVPAERQRLADEMLKGFRYCRLAGGLYWRGLDAAKKQLQPRWPEQLAELKELLDRAGVEGLSFEYWSPPPYWKANQSYIGAGEKDPLNQLRCFASGFENDAPAIKPGHWIYNPWNWNAVGSFVKHMPWDSVAVELKEEAYDANARIFGFKRPDGKLTIVVSNKRADAARGFTISTGLENTTWKGCRYTPDEAGENTMGVPIGEQSGAVLNPHLPPRSWEFWVQQ